MRTAVRTKRAFAMRDAGASIILEHARRRQYLTYPQFWAGVRTRSGFDIGHPWRQIPILLEYISDYAFEDIGLFMTAFVVDEDPLNGRSEGSSGSPLNEARCPPLMPLRRASPGRR